MNTSPSSSLLLVSLLSLGCHCPANAGVAVDSDRESGLQTLSAGPSNPADATWAEIKQIGFAKRSDFESGLDRLNTKVELQVQELRAKRATLKADPMAWDFAMKEMDNARAYLMSMTSEVKAATIESTWNDRKEKAGLAWERTQKAYRNVEASTTS